MTARIFHIVFSGEYGPFDRALEIGVFGLILYEVWIGISVRWKERKRKKLLARIRVVLSHALGHGDQLRQNAPDAQMQADHPWSWLKEVDLWSEKTANLISEYSTDAASAFTLIKQSNLFINSVELPNSVGRVFRVESDIRESYQRLVMQLSNLAEIMQKMEIYF